MPSPVRRLARAAALAAAIAASVAAAASPAAAQSRGLRYTFTLTESGGDKVSRGTVHSAGGRTRIEMRDDDGPGRQWLLVTDHGRTMLLVSAKERSYSEVDADQFAGLVGTVMRGLDKVMTIDVDEMAISTQRLGPGGTIAGHETERWALTQEFVVNVGMFGKTSPEMHRIVTDYWIARDVVLPRNPLVELVMQSDAALAQADREFVELSERRRGELPRGAALRIVVTSASSDADRMTAKAPRMRRLDVTELQPGAVIDDALLQVPAGYTRKEGLKNVNFSF